MSSERGRVFRYTRAKELVGERDPRAHEFSIQLRAMDMDNSGQTLLMPVAARRQLLELPDQLATKISIEFYADATDAFSKAIAE